MDQTVLAITNQTNKMCTDMHIGKIWQAKKATRAARRSADWLLLLQVKQLHKRSHLCPGQT